MSGPGRWMGGDLILWLQEVEMQQPSLFLILIQTFDPVVTSNCLTPSSSGIKPQLLPGWWFLLLPSSAVNTCFVWNVETWILRLRVLRGRESVPAGFNIWAVFFRSRLSLSHSQHFSLYFLLQTVLRAGGSADSPLIGSLFDSAEWGQVCAGVQTQQEVSYCTSNRPYSLFTAAGLLSASLWCVIVGSLMVSLRRSRSLMGGFCFGVFDRHGVTEWNAVDSEGYLSIVLYVRRKQLRETSQTQRDSIFDGKLQGLVWRLRMGGAWIMIELNSAGVYFFMWWR